jgi:hypothetical protein
MQNNECKNSEFKVWTWKNPVMLHWIINPGLAINELILGQKVPKIILIEKHSSKIFEEKIKIPCPHCNTIHSGLKWSIRNNAYKNWFGLYCDNCGKTIPCLTNLTSLVLILVTFPFWIWFKEEWKKQWLLKQPKRYINLDLENVPNPFEGYNWIKQGLIWGIWMFVFSTVSLFLIDGVEKTNNYIFFHLISWLIGGLMFGFTMKLFTGRPIKMIIYRLSKKNANTKI